MQLQGVIVDFGNEKHVRVFGNWPLVYDSALGEVEFIHSEHEEELQGIVGGVINEVEDQTWSFMVGQGDGKVFIFSDNDEGISIINEKFPDFELVSLEDEEMMWDYDYRRDS